MCYYRTEILVLTNCILCLQLYTLVLALEELERRGVAGLGEAEREEMVAKREELTTKAFVLLRLKPLSHWPVQSMYSIIVYPLSSPQWAIFRITS